MTQQEIYKFSENRKQIIEKVVVGDVTTYYIGLCDRTDYTSTAAKSLAKWRLVKKTINTSTGIIEQFAPVTNGVPMLDFESIWNSRTSYTYL